jgi:hypothetical protein
MASCTNRKDPVQCSCTYPGCSRHAKCCECVNYHRTNGEVPGCFFSAGAERTYDRSMEAFIRDQGR